MARPERLRSVLIFAAKLSGAVAVVVLIVIFRPFLKSSTSSPSTGANLEPVVSGLRALRDRRLRLPRSRDARRGWRVLLRGLVLGRDLESPRRARPRGDVRKEPARIGQLSSFGVGSDGALYAVSVGGGRLYRLVP